MYKISRVIALFTFAAMILVPSLIVVLGSFKTDAEVYNKPLSLPESWSLGNYSRLLSDSDLDVSFRNSVFVTVSSVLLTLILASLASFAIARMITVSGKVLAVLLYPGEDCGVHCGSMLEGFLLCELCICHSIGEVD